MFMKYQKFIPLKSLNQFINNIIAVEISYKILIQEKTRVLPNGHTAMAIHFTSSMMFCQEISNILSPNIFFCGNINKQIILKPIGDLDCIIFQFKPNALYHLLSVSMRELNSAQFVLANGFLNYRARESHQLIITILFLQSILYHRFDLTFLKSICQNFQLACKWNILFA
jgi:hypothetical protein